MEVPKRPGQGVAEGILDMNLKPDQPWLPFQVQTVQFSPRVAIVLALRKETILDLRKKSFELCLN